MNQVPSIPATHELPVKLKMVQASILLVVDESMAGGLIDLLLESVPANNIAVVFTGTGNTVDLAIYPGIECSTAVFTPRLTEGRTLVMIASSNRELRNEVESAARSEGALLYIHQDPVNSDFHFLEKNGKNAGSFKRLEPVESTSFNKKYNWQHARTEEQRWKRIATRFIIVFGLMVIGHVLLSSLPLPQFNELVDNLRPYFDYQFLFFIIAGFAAQMIDGMLSMGYGVTSATCLMSFGVSPVSISAAIHTSEIFTSGISGYSHYRFGNVNMKLFRHLVIPGVIGAVLGALLLVFLGERAGSWLMPLLAVYAMFLGIKILVKAFSAPGRSKKVRRLGWLAWTGGFFDSFGGGGWGPIVTSTLIAKGRSPKYTIGSVSLTEFFLTLASATTFFITVGIQHWNIVLGLLIGGAIAAPIAARLSGILPRKTMMIAVGIMVIIWCVRMIIKTIF